MCPSPCVSLHTSSFSTFCSFTKLVANAQQSTIVWQSNQMKVITQKFRKVGNLRNVYQRQSSILIFSYLWKSLPPSSKCYFAYTQWVNNIYKEPLLLSYSLRNFVPMKFHWNTTQNCLLYQFDVVPLRLVLVCPPPAFPHFATLLEIVANHNSQI